MNNLNDCKTVKDVRQYIAGGRGDVKERGRKAYTQAVAQSRTEQRRLVPLVMAAVALNILDAEGPLTVTFEAFEIKREVGAD